MTGFTVDPGELATAATVLRDATTSVAEVRFDQVDAGPGRLNAVVAVLSADTQEALTSVAGSLAHAAETVADAGNAYLRADSDATGRLR
ncbi:hypothetical protein [Actinokineospora globicatena]|uniref:Excreted virulence factor EspC, type VII ESX diderm n=1 Tax=Actinokineospora globicatena TaxID=103729 RepID=A0A9W6VAY9_9PSEU|nr:hypothetical protein [Actinokineospora globicatena]MCP2301578.1 hypothetical protein [Actinokineospora globicatena]GLW76770.1 hypothetical protein Aglo01_12520 [Actinokineospora globicatena]GLW83603.1 hypothetical protein Aglo02_12430 [Actinokineospora globicatena]GLW92448.1 hypothetical protein Aglo03_32640 [Actinokineospora globicatena]